MKRSWTELETVARAITGGWATGRIGARGTTGVRARCIRSWLSRLRSPTASLWVLLLILTSFACGREPSASVRTKSQAIAQETPPAGPGHRLVMSLPAWAQPRTSALTALRELRVNDRAKVVSLDSDEIAADVASTGTSETNLGVESRVRDVTSRANITVRDRGVVTGTATTGGMVYLGAGASVQGTIKEQVGLSTTEVQFSLDWASSGPNVEASTSVFEVPPGRYGRMAIQTTNLELSSGVYELDDLYVAPQRSLLIDNSSGPVVLLVKGSVTLHGNVGASAGERPDWILAYSGTQEIPITNALHGAIFAPQAKVSLSSGFRHEGSILARDIEAHQQSTFAHDRYGDAWKRLCDVVGGRGGFCSQILVAGGLDNCLFALQPWVVGRNGHDPISLVDELTFTVAGKEVVLFTLKTDRALAHAFTSDIAQLGSGWEHEVSASAAAWGDVDGDGRQELLLGRSAHDNARLILYDDVTRNLSEIEGYLSGWGDGFGVKAIATGNLDADDRDEVVVARNASSGGIEVSVLDGVDETVTSDGSSCPQTRVRLQVVEEIDIGDRDAFDVVIGDFDNDGENELAIAKGGNSSFSPRIRIVEFSPSALVPSIVGQQDIGDWGASRDARALAVGDIQGDGIMDLAVGRSDGSGVRYEIYNFINGQYEVILDGGEGWGDDRSVTTMTFGDVDADGDDELIVGRDGRSCTFGCDPSVKGFVFDTNESGNLVELASFGSGWGADRGVISAAVGDVNGDGVNDILLGRSEGDGDRVLIYNGPLGDFEQIATAGTGWGDDRSAPALAISSDYLCQVFPPESTVVDADAAAATVDDRITLAVRNTVNQFIGRLSCETQTSLIERAEAVLGKWDEDTSNQAGRRILAGLAAIQLGLPEGQTLLDAQFLGMVDAYILNRVAQFKAVGTNADFDFQQMVLAGILYRFRTATLAGGQFLLSDQAVQKLLNIDCDPSCPDRTVPHNLLYEFSSLAPAAPESENHILMINTWHYLVGQWVAAASPRQGALPQAPANALETKVLDLLARVVTNDLWETNARPYAALTLRAITLLASYAGSESVRTAASNAADFLATKYAFQSLHGKRSAPMRRSWEYKTKHNLYEGEYGTSQFGILTGDYVFDSSPGCEGSRCRFRGGQALGYALEAALMPYRLPRVVVEHMLQPDGGNAGHGTWARMQARFPEGIYDAGKEPDYPSVAPGDAVEPAHEFYFRTADYLNSAGGRYEAYSTIEEAFESEYGKTILATLGLGAALEFSVGFPIGPIETLVGLGLVAEDRVKELAEKTLKGTHFVTRPSTLIGGNDIGYWYGLGNAELHTLLFRGDHDNPWQSANTGTYKNFTFGYSNEGAAPALSSQFDVAAGAVLGGTTIQVLDPDSLSSIFPAQNQYVVVGTIDVTPQAGRSGLGFYEVVPRQRFSSAQELAEAVLSSNSAWASDPFSYVMTVSGERLTLNPQYPYLAPPDAPPLGVLLPVGPPFTAIDGDETALADRHHLGSSQTANFPLIDVREVDENFQLTGVHLACSIGDGLVLVNHPGLGERYVIDSRDPQAPKSCTQPFVDDCPALLAGQPLSLQCP